MSTITNYDYLLRNYYSSNRLARKSYNRVNMKSSELASADSAAIKKVAKTLKDMEYNTEIFPRGFATGLRKLLGEVDD